MLFKNILLPSFPAVLYLILLVAYYRKFVGVIPPARLQVIYDQGMALCLNLLGFGITILCVLLALGENMSQNQETTLFHLCFSIGFFLLSYTLFRLRIREIFVFIAGAFKNAGLWTLISASMFFLVDISSAYIILLSVLILFTIYLGIDLFFTMQFYSK